MLLTGIGGFVGSHTFAHLMHNTDHEVVGVDSFRHRGLTDRVTHMLEAHPDWSSRLKVYTHDLNAPFSNQLTKDFGVIDYIISMASDSHVDRSIEDPVRFVQNNTNLALNMLELARKIEPYIFLNVGTDEVYGAAEQGQLHKEWDPIIPSNPYSASKACQEAIAISYWRTYDVPVVLVNSMNIIGELQHPEKMIPMTIRNIYNGTAQIIHGNEFFVGSRFYIHARNMADGLLFTMSRPPARYSSGDSRPDRYNIVGEKELTNLEVAQMVAGIMDRELKWRYVDFHNSRPGHDRRYALDGSKMESLGWKPPLTIEQTMEATVNWYLANPRWLEL